VGFLDELNKLDLADDVKQALVREHTQEATKDAEEVARLRAQARTNAVNEEIDGLKKLGFDQAPGLLKFVRRVFLSDDEQPGAVLLSDADMQLSGDAATGATSREDISVAGAVRQFISLLPKNNEGKLALSDQAIIDNSGDGPERTDAEDPAKKTAGARERLGGITGHTVDRSARKRYRGGGAVAGGGS
jgi:hypothetical protein